MNFNYSELIILELTEIASHRAPNVKGLLMILELIATSSDTDILSNQRDITMHT